MKRNQKLSSAIVAILGVHAATAYAQQQAGPSGPVVSSDVEIADIVVTAQRRSESIQDVPITIQALTSETLTQLNVATFDDYVKFLPNVTSSNQGPGQSLIYMRGLATTEDGEQSSGATGSFPNVAVYLDEQSAQLPGRNLDVYAVDMERIEVLEGPQGTLYGAGAQAGAIRYITNKPKMNVTEGVANAGFGTTAGGDASSSVSAAINVPLIPDKLAVRGVFYNDSRGGYINNVPSAFTRKSTDVGIVDYFNSVSYGNPGTGVVPPSPVIRNDGIAGKGINPVTYKGLRVSALVNFNDDWNALVTQSYQAMEADGVFAAMPYGSDGQKLPDYSVTLFNPSWDKDRFTNTAWTVNGKFGALKAVYTGGYLVRNVEQVADYTNYARGVYADYYQCILPGSLQATRLGVPNGECFSPSATFHVIEKNTHQSHEFRLSTPDDQRIRAIGGLFWEDFKIQDQSDWLYRDPAAGFVPLQAPAGAGVNNPNVRVPTDAFYDDVQRGYKQFAAFTSWDFELIPKTLTVTAGTRYYRMSTYEIGAKAGSYGCRAGGYYSPATEPAVCTSSATVLDTLPVPAGNSEFSDSSVGLRKVYKGFRSRVNLTWKVTSDAMLYYTWSQGFRPGGFNRASGFVAPSKSPVACCYETPIGFKPDTLINNELGWKTEWLQHRLQFNGSIYQEDWKNVQIGLFDPGVLGNLTFTTNGPDYRVKGLETEIVARITRAFTVTGGASWNRSELIKAITLYQKDGTAVDWISLGLRNPFGQLGDPLANAPPFQANLRARYDFEINNYNAFWQLAGTRRSHSYATTDRLVKDLNGNSIAYDQPGFSSLDASFGVAKDAWNAQVYIENVTNVQGDLFSTYNQWIKMNTLTRPRTISLRAGYKF